MMSLFGGHGDVPLVSRSHFLRSWTSVCTAAATVVADAVDRGVVVDNRGVVGVVHGGDVHVSHRAVGVVVAASPIATEEANAGVAKTVVNAAIETDLSAPVAGMPTAEVVVPAPV